MIHTCPECGHEVRTTAELDGQVEHRPDGGHRWTLSIPVSGGRKNFGA